MDHNAGSLDVTQELVSKTNTFRCTFDQSRNICDNKSVSAFQVYHTKVWCQGSEMIVGDLWLCVGYTGKECGFSYVRVSYQSDICDYFQLQTHFQFLCRLTWLCVLRNLHGSSCIVHVSFTAASAF